MFIFRFDEVDINHVTHYYIIISSIIGRPSNEPRPMSHVIERGFSYIIYNSNQWQPISDSPIYHAIDKSQKSNFWRKML